MEPRKCWIMVRQSWDCYCSLLLLVNSVPQRRARELGGVLVWEDMSAITDQIWASFELEMVSPHGIQVVLTNLLSLPELLWLGLGPQDSICPAWNLDSFAPVCIDMSKDDGSDALWELIPRTAEWPSLQREYLCSVLFTPWILHFVKSNYTFQARIVFHNFMLLTVYTYTGYVQIIFIQVRLTEQLPDTSVFLLEF